MFETPESGRGGGCINIVVVVVVAAIAIIAEKSTFGSRCVCGESGISQREMILQSNNVSLAFNGSKKRENNV